MATDFVANGEVETGCAHPAADKAIDGPHRRLARMAGEWEGVYRLWFERDMLAAESTQRCAVVRNNSGFAKPSSFRSFSKSSSGRRPLSPVTLS